MMLSCEALLRRLRWLTAFVIVGLVFSGLTAIPLPTEVKWLVGLMGGSSNDQASAPIGHWLSKVQGGLDAAAVNWPFLFYGTDWLAFGHLAIALAFVGAWRDPVRNRWLYTFGLITSALVIPWALAFGAARGIPLWWRAIDCSFGILAFLPLWYCRRWARELDRESGCAAGPGGETV